MSWRRDMPHVHCSGHGATLIELERFARNRGRQIERPRARSARQTKGWQGNVLASRHAACALLGTWRHVNRARALRAQPWASDRTTACALSETNEGLAG